MAARPLIIAFLIALGVFAAALVYFQYFAFYERVRDETVLEIGDLRIEVEDLDKIDADTSPLKLRACFRTAPDTFDALPAEPDPVPLTPPPWFSCFDPAQLERDLKSGKAQARRVATDTPKGFDLVVAHYADGRGYLWRQLNAHFKD